MVRVVDSCSRGCGFESCPILGWKQVIKLVIAMNRKRKRKEKKCGKPKKKIYFKKIFFNFSQLYI